MATAIFCIARTPVMVERIVDQLRTDGGVRDKDISVLFPDREGSRDFAHEHHTKAPEGAVAGVGAGSIAGGGLGLLVGIGALAIPGVGPLIAAGPILAALSGMAVGAAVGGIAGALIGMGIPEFEAKCYEDMVKGGNILMSVHSESSKHTQRIKDIFRKAGAEDISTAHENDLKQR